MATKKFSEFDLVPTPVLGDIVVVGLDELGQNAQFPGDVFGGAAWGDITGTLADQTDLNSALNGKEDSLGNPATNGYILSSTTAGVRSWIVPPSGGGGTWGSITGTLSDQTDLQSALNAKLTAASVSPNLPTFTVPASTTISTFGASLVDDANAAAAIATLGLDADLATFSVPASTTISTFGASLVNDTTLLGAQSTLYITNPWTNKAADEPIVVLMFGDSNAIGADAGVPGLQTDNSRVFTWQADYSSGSPTTYDPTTCSWKNVDPTDDVRDGQIANTGSGQPYVGLRLGNRGMTAWAIADRIQRRTGRDVYIYAIGCAGTTLKYWTTPLDANAPATYDNKGYVAINNGTYGLTAALAAIPGTAPTYADIVFMQDGTNDCAAFASNATGFTATTFLADFESIYDTWVSEGWISQYNSLWFNGETGQEYANYSPRNWMGHQYVANAAPNNVTCLSSYGMFMPDGVHFSDEDLVQWGNIAADLAFSGLGVPTFVRSNNYVEQVAPVLRGNTTHSTGVMTSTVAATGGTDVAWLFNTPSYSATDRLFKVQNNGTDRMSLLGNGDLALSGDIGTSLFYSNFLGGGSSLFLGNVGFSAAKVILQNFNDTVNEKGFVVNMQAGTGPVTAAGIKGIVLQNDGTDTGFYVDKTGVVAATSFVSVTGGFLSEVTDGATADGFTFNTPAYTTAGANIASFKNNGAEKVTIDKDGNLTAVGIGTADFYSNFLGYLFTTLPIACSAVGYKNFVVNGASAVAHTFDTGSAFTTTAKLVNWKNNGTEKAYINQAGSLGLLGGFRASYVSKTSSYTATVDDFSIIFTTGTNTLTLFKCASATAGQIIIAINESGNNLTFATTGGDAITGGVLATGQTRWYQSDGASTWRPIAEYS